MSIEDNFITCKATMEPDLTHRSRQGLKTQPENSLNFPDPDLLLLSRL